MISITHSHPIVASMNVEVIVVKEAFTRFMRNALKKVRRDVRRQCGDLSDFNYYFISSLYASIFSDKETLC